MAIPHLKAGQSVDVRPYGDALPQRQTHALFKSADLELLRLVLPRGKSLPPHRVPGEITIQCLEGQIDVTTPDGHHPLAAGQLLYLEGNVEHGVQALDDASALVTIALKPAR